jgi:hypothetical protein
MADTVLVHQPVPNATSYFVREISPNRNQWVIHSSDQGQPPIASGGWSKPLSGRQEGKVIAKRTRKFEK